VPPPAIPLTDSHMACVQCGAPIDAPDPFCPKCGARQVADLPVPVDTVRATLERALGGQYDILRLLGRGGMGTVYLARERSLDRLVAIKILPPEYAAADESRERFRREARTAAKLTHANIVPLYAFGDVEGMLYFVMGYVRGESLGDRLRREGKLPADVARRILREVADALEHAHRNGVVHRDIKPDNILIEDETGRPMLTDFGVAKARVGEGTLTAAGVVVGTPLYMSPEQASGAREIDGRSDLYSLGVLGYAMLAGRTPFEGQGFQELIVQHISREPPPLEALAPDAPRDLVAAVTKCLAKAPEQRWADARSLAAAVGSDDVEEEEEPEGPPLTLLDQGLVVHLTVGLVCIGYVGIGVAVGRQGMWGPLIRDIGLFLGALGPAGVALMQGGAALVARRRGHSWREIKALFLRPPPWWPGWWPAAGRRRGDVWPRLPEVIRRARVLWTLSVGFLLSLGLGTLGLFAAKGLGMPDSLFRDLLLAPLLLGSLGGGGCMFAAMHQRERWGRTIGLTAREAALAAERPTSDLAFWRRPKFAALLLPSPGRVVDAPGADPKSAEELARAIRELVGQLPSDTRVTVSEADEAARQVAKLIVSLDAELTNLTRDADPQELEAIEAKLRALGPETSDEGDVRRQKRALLANQRDLLRQLDQRLASVNERRARLVDMLRTLWLQLANLRAEAAHDVLAVSEISGRVRALCADIDAQVKAAETVRGVTGS